MKSVTKSLSLVLAVLMLVSLFGGAFSVTSSAYDTEGDYEYAIYGSQAEGWYSSVHLYKGKGENPIIPETLGGLTVKNIGMSAFENKTKIKSVTIPDTVVTISGSAFKGCTNLAQINFPETVNNIDTNSFDGTKWLNNQPEGMIYVNSILAYKYKGDCPATFTVRDGTKVINQGAFKDCTALETVILPDSVITIRGDKTKGAFHGCTSLKNISLPKNFKNLGSYIFTNCTALERIDIPSGVTSIGQYVFENCTALAEVNLPDGLKSISYCAFKGCTALNSITLPASINSIMTTAFDDSAVSTIYGYSGSYAEEFAASKEIAFISLGALPTEPSTETQAPTQTEATEPVTETQAPTQTEATEPATETQTTTQTEATEPVTETQAPTQTEVTEPVTETQAPTQTEATEPVTETQAPTQTEATEPTQTVKKDISKWTVKGIVNKTYTGKAITQKVTVVKGSDTAIIKVDYLNNKNAGNATVIIKGVGDYTGTVVRTFTIKKADNPLTVTVKNSVTASAKKKTTVKKAVTVKNAQGKVTYKTNNKKVTVKNGAIIVSKGFKKGTYKIKVKITAKGNANYKLKTVEKKLTVKVK